MAAKLSLRATWLCCFLIIGLRMAEVPRYAISWDVFGYYLYLPATLIHDDVALQNHAWLDELFATYEPSTTQYQVVDAPDGARVIKYSAGMAVAYAPWFLLAHALAEPLGFPADGLSPPYQWIITYGCLLYILVGLFLFRRVLLHYFSDGWAAVLILLITCGTNYLHLAAWDGTLLTHPLLFTLFAALLLATIQWHERPTLKHALMIGGLLGFITLVRPSEGVVIIVPLLWGLGTSAGRARKWTLIRAHSLHLVWAIAAFLIATCPQLIYWHATTGQWLFYSYVNPGEGFDFATPHTLEYLFSARKGWFLYTPLMAIALLGIIPLHKRLPALLPALIIYLLVDLWIVSSWSCWWYAGGSFSARSMVPTYVFLAIPLGALLSSAWERTRLRWGLSAVVCAAVALNLFQTWQWRVGILPHDRVTMEYYAAVFASTSAPNNTENLLLVDHEASAINNTRYVRMGERSQDFDDRSDSTFTLTNETPFSPGIEARYDALTNRDHAVLRTSARLWIGDSIVAPPTLVMTFQHAGGSYCYRTTTWTIPEGTRNQWVSTNLDYITPEVRALNDTLKVYVWNQHGGTHRIDDLRVEILERKAD